MKKIALVLLSFLVGISVFSQKWEYTIGQPNQYEASRRVIEHYDRGYLISAQLQEHGWLVKTDINGNVLWDKVIGTEPDQVITEKTVFDSYGNLYIFGTIIQEIEPLWPVVIKLDACGELQWCRQLYFEEYEFGQFYDAILLDNGDLLGVANMPDDDQHDMIFLFCISPEGEYKWKQSYASCDNYPNFEMRLGSRIQFFDDICIISGYVYSPHPNYPNTSSIRPMFIGIDAEFNELFVLECALTDNIKGKAYDCISLNDSVMMGVGTHRFVEGGEIINNTILMFFDQNGTEYGYNIIKNEDISPSIKSNFIYDIERINDSLFLGTAAYGEDYEGNPWGEFVIDTSGTVFQHETREGTAASSHINKTFDNKYVIASSYWYPDLSYDVFFYKVNEHLEHDTVYPGNYTYDSLCTKLPIQSGEIDLTGCEVITSVEEIPTLEEYNKKLQSIPIKASPNPSGTGEILLEMENTGLYTNMELKVFDVYGKQIHSEKVYPHQGATRMDVSQWPGGMYIATVFSNGQVRGKCKVVVE